MMTNKIPILFNDDLGSIKWLYNNYMHIWPNYAHVSLE